MSVPKDHDGAWLLSEGPLSADLLKRTWKQQQQQQQQPEQQQLQ